jgi:hypothetical protein
MQLMLRTGLLTQLAEPGLAESACVAGKSRTTEMPIDRSEQIWGDRASLSLVEHVMKLRNVDDLA